MIIASADDLQTYLVDLVETLESYAITVLPPNDRDEIELGREDDGGLVVDLECRLPVDRRSRDVILTLFERWRPTVRNEWICVEYSHELLHHQLQYRRALHRHHESHFVRAFALATHEHCEVTVGVETCRHYAGDPVVDAFDALERLYGQWLSGEKPDCSTLPCLD